MKSTTFALVASFLSIASASPLNFEREAEPVLDIEYVTAVEVATAWATVYATEGAQAPATTYAAPAPVAETTTVARGKGRTRTWNWHKDSTSTTSTSSTSSTPPPPPPPTTTSTSIAAEPTYEAPSTTEQPAWTPPVVPTTYAAPTSTWQAPAASPTSSYSGGAPSSYEGDDSYSSANLELAIQNSTNTYRSMFQAAPLAWNQSLVDMAVASAAKCDFEHSNAGQNLAAGYSGPEGAVGGWGDEYKSFDFSHPDFTESTGHFTQLVWQDSTTQGCAAKKCPTDGSTGARGWYLVCNYFPVGNMLGEFPQNIKNKAS